MPEGDTLFRTAAGLRPYLVGRPVTAASARQPGPQVERIVGSEVTGVEARGKNLLIRFANGLEVRTHLGMHGSWHRYRPGERWRRPAARARLIIEVPGSVAVCFDAPTVELFEQRAEALHGALSVLGPDLLRDPFDMDEATRRLRDPARASLTIAQALLDQRALAGIGNVYKSEILFIERVSPFRRVRDVDDETLARLVGTARRLLLANAARRPGAAERVTTEGHPSADGPLWVYRRAGRPCRRCGVRIRSVTQGADLPRLTFWCPRCQPEPEEPSMTTIDVRCEIAAGGWTCAVTVDDGRGTPTRHAVSVAAADLARLDPGAATPDDLVRRSFEFLLERESKASILGRFDLMVIARYFPEYERTIRE